jgi:hypothetical protein
MLDRLRRLFGRRRPVPDGESDVAADPYLARSRATGGRPTDAEDRGATTGTGDSEEFVGRVAGQDEGFAGDTGAERRARGSA